MPVRCRTLGAPPPGGGTSDLSSGNAGTPQDVIGSLQTEARVGCAFDAAGDLVGWVFRSIEDNLDEADPNVAVSSLILIGTDGTTTTAYDPVAAGHTLGNCASDSAGGLDGQLHCICLEDDVLGDGSNIVDFVRVYKVTVDPDTNIPTTVEIGTGWEDCLMLAPYTVVGTEQPRGDSEMSIIGVSALGANLPADGPTWAASTRTASIAAVARGGSATVNSTDSDGNPVTFTLPENVPMDWSPEDGDMVINLPFEIVNGAGTVDIVYTTLLIA